MKSQLWWKWLILAGLVIASLWVVLPVQKNVRLGLDLSGGYSCTVQIDRNALEESVRDRNSGKSVTEKDIQEQIDEALAASGDTAVEIVRSRIDSLGTEEPVITKGQDGRIYVQIPKATDAQYAQVESVIRRIAKLDFRLVHPRNAELVSRVLNANNNEKLHGFVRKDNGFIQDPESKGKPLPDPRTYRRSFGNPPPGFIFALERDEKDPDFYHPIFIDAKPRLGGEDIRRADVGRSDTGKIEILLSFKPDGTQKFGNLTEANVGRQLAIVLDGIVYSAPNIREPITGGRCSISGSFTPEEAATLKNVLNAGAMPAPLEFMGSNFVDPTLGRDTVADAKVAILVGSVGVLLFMFLYYRRLGLVADLALLLNFILLPVFAIVVSGLLSQVSPETTTAAANGGKISLPVLTLPGIAGILLTVGMAVDANVLIYERVREEIQRKRPTYPSLMAGYDRAFSAIFDGNITTIVTGVILFVVGTGLIRGFSITLIAGIVASMFTALFATKIIFQTLVGENSTWKIKMMQAVPDGINLQFVKKCKSFIVPAVAIIVVTIGLTVYRGLSKPESIFAIDFTGGTKITYTVTPKAVDGKPVSANISTLPAMEEVRKALVNAGISDAEPQYQYSTDKNASSATLTVMTTLEQIKSDSGSVDVQPAALAALTNSDNKELSKADFRSESAEKIGSQIGSEMKKTAFWAILLATVAMLLYIGFRFEFGFGIGAIVALVHDVLITIGIFATLGFKFNLTIVAALLTIVGYGVNDTIVLFDRVREEIRRDQKTAFPDLVNRCVNQTLSRTVLTSITTLIPVVSLVVFCKGDIRGFGVCVLIGVVVSTLSSIFIASPMMLAWYKNKRPDLRKAS